MTHTQIDRKAPEIMGAIATAPVYKKQGKVKARPAKPGESIITILHDGSNETTNMAKEGDWIVTNPSGERYIISREKFLSRYEPDPHSFQGDGSYVAKGSCRAIVNPFGKPIEIMASWGQPQTGGTDCMIADTCDQDGSNLGGEPYLIDAAAFAETYKQVEFF